MAKWQFFSYDLSTGTPRGTVRMSAWQHEQRLNQKGSCTATIAPPQSFEEARTVRVATAPARSTITAVRVDDITGARAEFTLWIPPDGRRGYALTGGNLLSFYDTQTISSGISFTSLEQIEVVARLAQIADATITRPSTGATYAPGPKLITAGAGAASGVLRTQSYDAWTGKNLGEAMRDIASRQNGFDWAIRSEIVTSGGVATLERHYRAWYPRRGRTVGGGGPVFTLGYNLLSEPIIEPSGGFASTVIALGNEIDNTTRERRKRQSYNYDLLASGAPLVSKVIDRSDILTDATLDAQSIGYLKTNDEDASNEITIDVLPNPQLPDGTPGLYRYTDWDLGDDCQLVLPPEKSLLHPDGLMLERRIVGERWTVNENGEFLQLILGKKWSADDPTA